MGPTGHQASGQWMAALPVRLSSLPGVLPRASQARPSRSSRRGPWGGEVRARLPPLAAQAPRTALTAEAGAGAQTCRVAAGSPPRRRGRADLAHLHPALRLPPISPKPLRVAEGAGGQSAGSPGVGRRCAPLLPAQGDSHQTLGAFVPAAVRARGSLRPWSPCGRANYSSACPRPPRL